MPTLLLWLLRPYQTHRSYLYTTSSIISIPERQSNYKGQPYNMAADLTPAEVLIPALLPWMEQRDTLVCHGVWRLYLHALELIAEKPHRLPLKLAAMDPQR